MLETEKLQTGQNHKIKDLNELSARLATLRESQKIVLCHGVFDLLHIGHIRYFEQARKFGNVLVVTITPDRFVNKGTHRPVFSERLRAEALAALHCVDFVAINQWDTAVQTIQKLKPHFYVKGKEYSDAKNDVTGKIKDEAFSVQSVGGQLVFTDDITYSSSTLINRYLPTFSEEVCEYLNVFKERHTYDEIVRWIESARKIKVLLIGETIIDEYQYCDVIGKSAKEPILAAKCLGSEKFPGGILAVANHVANFCDEVGLLTLLGEEESQEHFIRSHIPSNVNTMFVYKKNSPTIVKKRFVENYSYRKLFETYTMNDEALVREEEDLFCQHLEKLLPKYDLVISVDYGHSLMSSRSIELLCSSGRYLSVNTQSNAGNRGFNTISKYPRADYICIAQHEIMLDTKKRWGTPRDMIIDLTKRVSCPKILLTQGKLGSISYREREEFCQVPAFDQQVVDRMGAGDAVISITSLLAFQDAPMEILGLVGNVVGSQAVAIVGHRTFIERPRLLKHIQSLLK